MKKVIVLDESKGVFARTKEQQQAQQKENDINLREAIMSAAEEAGLEVSPDLIAQAKLRFGFGSGEVRALSVYNDLGEFMQHHDHNAKKIRTVTQAVDERAIKKKQLYDELCHYAEIGDMKSYRSVRAEYASL
ncbi:hypothetical protein [Desulforhopalus sp. 52FAK]